MACVLGRSLESQERVLGPGIGAALGVTSLRDLGREITRAPGPAWIRLEHRRARLKLAGRGAQVHQGFEGNRHTP